MSNGFDISSLFGGGQASPTGTATTTATAGTVKVPS
jgi:hypothetical protein